MVDAAADVEEVVAAEVVEVDPGLSQELQKSNQTDLQEITLKIQQ